jgi:hypothetical protein
MKRNPGTYMLFFCLTASVMQAQSTTVTRDSSWRKALQTGLNVNQASFSDNWKGGGTNSIALGSFLNAKANYQTRKITFENDLQTQYGLVKNKDQEFRKNIDRIFFDSKVGYNLTMDGKWSVFVSLNFVSQFGNGFNYRKDSLDRERAYLISNFLSPGYLTSSFGLEYKPLCWILLFTGRSPKIMAYRSVKK